MASVKTNTGHIHLLYIYMYLSYIRTSVLRLDRQTKPLTVLYKEATQLMVMASVRSHILGRVSQYPGLFSCCPFAHAMIVNAVV